MNTYLCEISTKLCENIKSPKNTSLKLPPNHLKTIFIKPTDCLEASNIINKLKERQKWRGWQNQFKNHKNNEE